MGIKTRTASGPEFSPSVRRSIAAPPTAEPREQTPHENTISVAADAVPAIRPVAKAAARANDVLNVICRAAPITGCCQQCSCRQPTIPKSDSLLEQMNAIVNRLTSDVAQPPGREPLQRRLGLRG